MSAHKLGKHARGVDGAVTIQAKFGSAASFQSALWDGGVAKSLKEREKGLDAGMELLFGNNSAGGSGALASMFEDVPNIVPMQAHVPNPFPKSGKAPAVLAVVGEGDPVEADAINAGWKERIQSERAAASLRQKRVMRTSSGKLKAVDQSKRTLFVGNLPVSVRQKTVAQLFKGYGKVESVRFRSFAVKDLKMSRKAAFINKHFHESRDTCNAYVVFVEEDSVTLKRAVTEKNGTVVDGKYIRVDLVTGQAENPQHDTKATVFVGNLPFEITETQLREHFCGACNLEGVVNIRCVRDATTSLGKGIAFVQFDSEETAQAALTVHDTILQGTKRKLRVFRASAKASKRKLDAPQGNDRGPEDGGHRGPKRKREVGRAKPKHEKRKQEQATAGVDNALKSQGAAATGGTPAWQGQQSAAGLVPAEMFRRKGVRKAGTKATKRSSPTANKASSKKALREYRKSMKQKGNLATS